MRRRAARPTASSPPDRRRADVTERLEDRLARLERERRDADRSYNEALTALDRSLQPRPALPGGPPPYDATKLADVNRDWDILASGPPAMDGSVKGRLRAFIWRLVGPPLDHQRRFNASLVDHLNRNVATHQKTQEATERLLAVFEDHAACQVEFQSLLVRLLQTVTLYIDTKDRSTAGRDDVLNAALSGVTDTWLKRWESLQARDDRLMSSVADLRATSALAQQTALSLKREVERFLEGGATASAAAASTPPDLDAFKYLGFEDQFRGSPDDISARLAEYVPLFQGVTDVLDIGCGRGEFLALMKAEGISARGIDLNQSMVEECRTRGLDVTKADALSYVSGLADGSLGGLFAAQVVEHLEPAYLARLLETAAHKMRAGGLIVLETINPACWVAFFESYIRDLTHVRPLHPDTLQFLLRVSGFQDVSVAFKSPVGDSTRLESLTAPLTDASPEVVDIVETFNENVAKLNSRLFTYQDYAAIGRK